MSPDLLTDEQHGVRLNYARAEARTQQELEQVQGVLADWKEVDEEDEVRQQWEVQAANLRARPTLQTSEMEARARDLASTMGQTPEALLGQARLQIAQRVRAPRPMDLRTAACPVKGCATTVREGGATACQPRELPIDPSRADQPYVCPCERRALLVVGRTGRKSWTLREYVPDQDARQEINQIMHALVMGQAKEDRVYHARLDTSADPTESRMLQAGQASYHLGRQVWTLLLQGHLQAALDMAEQANTADYAYQLHARASRRQHKEKVREGRWKNAGRFYIEQEVQPRRDGQLEGQSVTHRFVFDFVAVYDETGGTHVMANAEKIERMSGVMVGTDGWRQLIALLTRFENKPGTKADAQTLIYEWVRDSLVLRRHIRDPFPRAALALEALRRTLEHLS
ncbi:hypothetical protein [Deinococcus hopiensis]|uniref:Uncharacterized protein n=1 Tax=Deinococcus hopiensis KR-140 TaxID=695939 RepID=A0A1W1UWJ5_9DEIO|nr:hypothetical protein [Deinococcus hopiensis]SMB85467.1 hypothetical protein SAMN00790413_03414 [Deinococcus hopiensis KR-140]